MTAVTSAPIYFGPTSPSSPTRSCSSPSRTSSFVSPYSYVSPGYVHPSQAWYLADIVLPARSCSDQSSPCPPRPPTHRHTNHRPNHRQTQPIARLAHSTRFVHSPTARIRVLGRQYRAQGPAGRVRPVYEDARASESCAYSRHDVGRYLGAQGAAGEPGQLAARAHGGESRRVHDLLRRLRAAAACGSRRGGCGRQLCENGCSFQHAADNGDIRTSRGASPARTCRVTVVCADDHFPAQSARTARRRRGRAATAATGLRARIPREHSLEFCCSNNVDVGYFRKRVWIRGSRACRGDVRHAVPRLISEN